MGDERWDVRERQFQEKFNRKEIHYEPLNTFTVKVLRGRSFTLTETSTPAKLPSTRVVVNCHQAVGQKSFATAVAALTRTPVWNEIFTFVLPESDKDAEIEVEIYHYHTTYSVKIGAFLYKASDVECGENIRRTVDMNENGQVDLEMRRIFKHPPDIRLSLGLCDGEQAFRIKRKQKTMEAIQKILGHGKGPRSLAETPTVGMAISGGGYRAIAASSGAMEAFMETDVFDSLMYCSGLSGSTWYVTAVYYWKSFANLEKLKRDHDWLRERMSINLFKRSLTEDFIRRFLAYREQKFFQHQKIGGVDLFGYALGETFLNTEDPCATLSSLRSYVEQAEAPFPILSTAHVRDKYPMWAFWDEVEMNPYEGSIANYGINIPTEDIDSVWSNAVLQRKLPELPLHYIMGACGNAFAVLFTHLNDLSEARQKRFDEEMLASKDGKISSDSDAVTTADVSSQITQLAEDYGITIPMDEPWVQELIKELQVHENRKKGSRSAQQPPPPGLEDVKPESIGRDFMIPKTGKLHNPARCFQGLQKYLLNTELVDSRGPDASKRIGVSMSTNDDFIELMDSGIGCNVSSIHLMRPQRAVDVLIVVDCEVKNTDIKAPSVDTIRAMKQQMSDYNMKFPEISIEKIMEDPFREVYIFEDPNDPSCPIVVWYTLYNVRFRNLKNPPRRPGYPTPDAADSGEVKFNDFDVSKEATEYGTTSFEYSALAFDRLRELMRFNIKSNIQVLKEKLALKVRYLRGKEEAHKC